MALYTNDPRFQSPLAGQYRETPRWEREFFKQPFQPSFSGNDMSQRDLSKEVGKLLEKDNRRMAKEEAHKNALNKALNRYYGGKLPSKGAKNKRAGSSKVTRGYGEKFVKRPGGTGKNYRRSTSSAERTAKRQAAQRQAQRNAERAFRRQAFNMPKIGRPGNRQMGNGRMMRGLGRAALRGLGRIAPRLNPYANMLDLLLQLYEMSQFWYQATEGTPHTVGVPGHWIESCNVGLTTNSCDAWRGGNLNNLRCDFSPGGYGDCPPLDCFHGGSQVGGFDVPYGGSFTVHTNHGDGGTYAARVGLGAKSLSCLRYGPEVQWYIPGRPSDGGPLTPTQDGTIVDIPATEGQGPRWSGEPVRLPFTGHPRLQPIGWVTGWSDPGGLFGPDTGGGTDADPDDPYAPINDGGYDPGADGENEPGTGGAGNGGQPSQPGYVDPGGVDLLNPGEVVTTLPPDYGTQERKIRLLTSAMSSVQKAFHDLSEVTDVVDVLHDALPDDKQCKKAARKGAPAGSQGCTLQEKLAALYNNMDAIDWKEAIPGLAANAIEDAVVGGAIGRAGGAWQSSPGGFGSGINRAAF